MTRARWLLHPLTTAVVLLAAGTLAALWALTEGTGSAGAAVAVTVAVAGAVAGFANSGST